MSEEKKKVNESGKKKIKDKDIELISGGGKALPHKSQEGIKWIVRNGVKIKARFMTKFGVQKGREFYSELERYVIIINRNLFVEEVKQYILSTYEIDCYDLDL